MIILQYSKAYDKLGIDFGKQGKWLATLQKLLVGHIPIPAKCESVLSQQRAVPALIMLAFSSVLKNSNLYLK